MKNIQDILREDDRQINEGFLLNNVTKITLNKLSSQELLDGILNMYDYIADGDDIKLFLQDFPIKDQLFWKNLYDLNQKKVWSIIDVDSNYDELKSIIPHFNQFVDVNVQFRRKLREIIKNSRNDKLAIQDNLLKNDNRNGKVYILTINRTTGLFKRIFRSIDAKFLKKIFEKIATGR